MTRLTTQSAETIRSLSRKAALLRTALDRRFSGIGLNSGQVAVLSELWQADGPTPAGIARVLGVAPPTITKLLRTMTDRGLVRTEQSVSDSRSVIVLLTEQGRAIREAVDDCWEEFGGAAFAEFTPTEILVFEQLIGKLAVPR